MRAHDRDKIAAAAAEWLARHDAGLSADEPAAFNRWLASDPRHDRAWREAQAMWHALDVPRQAGAAEGMIRELSARRRRRRVRWTASVAAGTMAAAAAWVVLIGPGIPEARTRSAEAVAMATLVRSEPERRTLADGSRVELNAGTELEVNFSADIRSVRLRRGAAHFTVMRDAARPFVVAAEAAEVRAVGTAFTVRAEGRGADVWVTEGTVAVKRPAAGPREPTLVKAGHRVAVPIDPAAAETLKVETVSATELVRLQAWRAPRLTMTDTPLAHVVAAMNRENALQLTIDDAALGRMKLSGVLRADDAASFVRLLETSYGVQAEGVGENRVVLRTKG